MDQSAITTITWALGIGLVVSVTIIGFGIKALFGMQSSLAKVVTNQERAREDHKEIKDLISEISEKQNEHESRIRVLESMRVRFQGRDSGGSMSVS